MESTAVELENKQDALTKYINQLSIMTTSSVYPPITYGPNTITSTSSTWPGSVSLSPEMAVKETVLGKDMTAARSKMKEAVVETFMSELSSADSKWNVSRMDYDLAEISGPGTWKIIVGTTVANLVYDGATHYSATDAQYSNLDATSVAIFQVAQRAIDRYSKSFEEILKASTTMPTEVSADADLPAVSILRKF